MESTTDFEKLLFLYKTEGKNMSIESFCVNHGVNYRSFDKWYRKEGLWMLYQAEGVPRNISIEQFCMNNKVNYNEFYKWYKNMHYGVYQLHIDGRPDNIQSTTLTAMPSKEYRVNPHAESTHKVYTSDGKQVLMSEEAYEIYKHQIDLNSKMHRRIHDMEFKDKMKSFGCIELLVCFPDGTQIMGNAKDIPHAMAWFKRVGDSLC